MNKYSKIEYCCIWIGIVTLKEMQIVRIVIVERKNALDVLPTGFGKSLVYQLMAPSQISWIPALDRQKLTRLYWLYHSKCPYKGPGD